jgi:hypothetical protein
MKSIARRVFLLVALLVAACAANDGDEIAGEHYEVNSGNGYQPNGYQPNGYQPNGMLSSKLWGTTSSTMDLLAAKSLPAAAAEPAIKVALDDARSREFLGYLVSCALPGTHTVTFKSADGTWTAELQGGLGVAGSWATGACGSSCQRAVSACIYSRINADARVIMLSVRGIGLPVDTLEKSDFNIQDGAFWGNLWLRDQNLPHIRACSPKGTQDDIQALRMRICGSSPPAGWDCSKFVIGACNADKACGAVSVKPCNGVNAADGSVLRCRDTKNYCTSLATLYTQVITTYRGLPCDASHRDYQKGVKYKPFCSWCANHTTKSLALLGKDMSQCTTTLWDADCALYAKNRCSAHSSLLEGEALKLGTSDTVDAVCAGLPDCCKVKWDAACVTKAKSL